MTRVDLIQRVIDGTKARTYLEIGTGRGQAFLRIRACRKIGVDPVFRLPRRWNTLRLFLNRTNLRNQYHVTTSDDFFQTRSRVLAAHGVDVALIDGLHDYEQCLRDVRNCLRFLNPNGVIVLHDCNPLSETEAWPAPEIRHLDTLNPHGNRGAWCGDVWKTIVHLRSTADELRVFVLDCDHGLGVVRRGQPDNMLPYDAETIQRLSYHDLATKRTELLNLRPPEYAGEFLRALGADGGANTWET